ncbi:MAG: hypothetical protein IT428_03290 [Planctomycetaceae bacterium]|nr:hypothetical protein [Planctomycetaceae bacterium]
MTHRSYVKNIPEVVHHRGQPDHPLFDPFMPKDVIPWCFHPRLKQDGTQTGRMPSVQPAIHNMPQKSAIKRMMMSRWRQYGGLHLQHDQSAIEVRILACQAMANDRILKEAFQKGFDAHKYVASIIV